MGGLASSYKPVQTMIFDMLLCVFECMLRSKSETLLGELDRIW